MKRDAAYTKTKAAINRMIRYWRSKLMMHRWRLRVEFRPTTPEGEEAFRASCDAMAEYREAMLRFTTDEIVRDNYDINELVAHELTHCLTHPLESIADLYAKEHPDAKEWVRQATERVVTDIADIFVALDQEYRAALGSKVKPVNPKSEEK